MMQGGELHYRSGIDFNHKKPESTKVIEAYRELEKKDSRNKLLPLMELIDNSPAVAFSGEYKNRFVWESDKTEEDGLKRYRLALETELVHLNANQNN